MGNKFTRSGGSVDFEGQYKNTIFAEADKTSSGFKPVGHVAETRPFYERWGYRQVADIHPFESLNRRSARHLNPIPHKTPTAMFVVFAICFSGFTTLVLRSMQL
jgi:hypothetical protein